MSGCSYCEDGEGAKLIERARVVAVLDGWRAKGAEPGRIRNYVQFDTRRAHWCALIDGNRDTHYPGETCDAARLAAARAVYPELPADVRAELGECP